MYTCGPTVYDYVHIGNLRTYIFEDVMRRVFIQNGYTVKHIMNSTDVDDKTIAASRKAGKALGEFTKEFENAFRKDLEKLSVLLPTRPFARATEHIPEMIRLIKKLTQRGYAYEKEGSVYFNVSAFKSYGKLAHLDKKGLRAGARVDTDEYEKAEAQDFVLWKARKENEPYWPSPFGDGRPGWHIECSAMSVKYLAQPFDIHAGGVDLIFPHHENEIAQSEAASGKQFARYWVHGEHLLVDGKKMSKSLGNPYTLRDIEAKGFDPLSFRYLLLTAHYRSKLNFTWESLTAAHTAREELRTFVADLLGSSASKRKPSFHSELYREKFLAAVNDDLNVPKALGIVWKFVNKYRKSKIHNPQAALNTMLLFDTIMRIGLIEVKPEKIPLQVEKQAQRREELRRKKKWREADSIRTELEKSGWHIDDTPDGPRVSKTF